MSPSSKESSINLGDKNELFILAIHNSPDVIWVKDLNSKYLMVNTSYLKFYNKSEDEIIGKVDSDIFSKELSELFLKSDKEVLQRQETTVLYFNTEHLNETKNIMTIKSPLFGAEGKIIGILGNSRDVTQSEKLNKELEESNAILNMIFEHAPDPIFVKDLNGIYTNVNRAFADFHGLTVRSAQGKTDNDLFDSEIAEKFLIEDKRIIDTGRVEVSEVTLFVDKKLRTTSVTKGPIFSKNYKPMGIMGIVHDITYNKQVAAKLIESQKMDSIGNLAGGIAHDLNNTLSGVMGYASLILTQESLDENKVYLEKIINASKRAAKLIDRLQTFTKKHVDQLISVDLNSIISDTYALINPSIQAKLKINLDLDSDLMELDGDPTQISQVVMNLLFNAIDSIEGQGKISISTTMASLADLDSYIMKSPNIKPGEFVKLTINDTGKGIPEELMDKIFEPFFTTKIDGTVKGNGLGLTIVYNVVTNHGGVIDVKSEINEGTTFDVYFPIGNLVTDEKILTMKAQEKLNLGLVLIVEDEEDVRILLGRMLTILGYTSISATNGLEGVAIFEERHNEIDLVFLDMVMPEMDGKDTFLQMKLIDSDVKVIISSGYTREKFSEILDLGISAILEKPYSINELSETINSVLR
ncbi:MAG: Blue-light-activated protein [Candidatus Heimdallarchaeota archaeon LC_2]|nr:MAG: Blue-light-activated protein [Candidatus Heimdallarchaeota archaeon LC_2]